MSAQPYPNHRADRAAWIMAEIRREHAAMLAMLPALTDPPTARLAHVWEAAAIKAMQLQALACELAGLESI